MTGTAELAHWRGFASFGWLVVLLAWETAAPFFPLFQGWRERGRHAVRNLALGLANGLITVLLFAVAWKWSADTAASHRFGLLNLGEPPAWAHAVLALLLLDLWTYWWHRICHVVPVLWRFHRVHHSDVQMDVTTANRFHLGEIILSSVLRLPLLPLLGIHFGELVLYETLLQAVVQWQHANIGLPPALERLLRFVVVTPGLHKVHHSRTQAETDSNYASLLSVWDALFRSRHCRADLENIRLGLDGKDGPAQQKLASLLREPFSR